MDRWLCRVLDDADSSLCTYRDATPWKEDGRSWIPGIIQPTFRFSGGVRAYTNVFQPVRPDARPAFGRVGSVGLARWPHIGPMR